MKPQKSDSMKPEDLGNSSGRQDWKSMDFGLGPEPPWGTPEWTEWVETQTQLAALEEVKQKQAKKAG